MLALLLTSWVTSDQLFLPVWALVPPNVNKTSAELHDLQEMVDQDNQVKGAVDLSVLEISFTMCRKGALLAPHLTHLPLCALSRLQLNHA